MKTCAKCHLVKDVSDFNKDSQKKDGLGSYCRSCHRARVLEYIRRPDVAAKRIVKGRAYYKKNAAKIYAYTLEWRRKNREKANALTREWERSEKGKAWKKAYRTARPELAQAREAIRKAVKRGAIFRPAECELCWQKGPVEAHHYKGYERKHWLHVQWVCIPCHNHANQHYSSSAHARAAQF